MKLLAIVAAGLFSVSTAGAALAQSRYSIPPAAVLSADLASPWLLQLRNRPVGGHSLELARPRPVLVPIRRERNLARFGVGVEAEVSVGVRRNNPRAGHAEPEFDPRYEMQVVAYDGPYSPGTIVIDTEARFLYLVEDGGMARRYGVGVGRPGFEWAGEQKVSSKREWPDWNPPAQMIAREAALGKILPKHMPGGIDNPLGARALYLGSTLYRIHGTNQSWSIGQAVSSGCIRMRNEDVIDLYERVNVGTRVIVT